MWICDRSSYWLSGSLWSDYEIRDPGWWERNQKDDAKFNLKTKVQDKYNLSPNYIFKKFNGPNQFICESHGHSAQYRPLNLKDPAHGTSLTSNGIPSESMQAVQGKLETSNMRRQEGKEEDVKKQVEPCLCARPH